MGLTWSNVCYYQIPIWANKGALLNRHLLVVMLLLCGGRGKGDAIDYTQYKSQYPSEGTKKAVIKESIQTVWENMAELLQKAQEEREEAERKLQKERKEAKRERKEAERKLQEERKEAERMRKKAERKLQEERKEAERMRKKLEKQITTLQQQLAPSSKV